MPLYYITGVGGSGKSTLTKHFKSLGFPAYDSDKLATFYNRKTGLPIDKWVEFHERTPEWTNAHQWRVSVDKINNLSKEYTNEIAFVCGSASNDSEYWDVFSKVFFLRIPSSELKKRLLGRTGNDYGKHPHELEIALSWNKQAPEYYKNLGAITINAHRPTKEIVEDILKHVK